MRVLAVIICTVAAGAALLGARTPPRDFYATRPVFERPFPAQRVPKGLASLSARECGTCHVEIYREWQQSVHAQAWPDPQFQAELHKQPGVSWMCVNCHTPLVNQIDSLVVALRDDDVERPIRRANPVYDASLRGESITCASCHVRDGFVEGPHRIAGAPHPVRYNPEFRDAKLCLRCHQAVQEYPGKNFVCTFNTGDEWRAGPHASAGRICQDCHMPERSRPLAAGGPVRRTGRHSWIGSRLRKGLEPEPALWDSLAALLGPGVALEAQPRPRARSGVETTWQVRAVNRHAGHLLPTGDPEREVVIELAAVTAAGDTLAQAKHVIAQRYQWAPVVRKLSDNRLKPGESRVIELRYRVPRVPYRLVARAVNSRISDANASYHRLPTWYPRRVEVARLEVAVRPEKL